MIKRILVTGLVAAIAVAAVRNSGLIGYARHTACSVKTWADDQVPVEKKLALLRTEVASLDRDVDKAASAYATEIVEVRLLAKKIDEKKLALDKEKVALLARGEMLKDATEQVKYGTRMVSVPEAKSQLNRDVKIFANKKTEVEALEKTLAHRESIRNTLAKQLDSLKTQKRELTVEIDAIEAEYRVLQLQQIDSKYQHDDSRLSHVKERLATMRKNLEIEKTKLELAPIVQEELPSVDTTASVDDILAPLNDVK